MDAGATGYLPAFELGRPLDGWAVGEVVDSRAAGFTAGDAVLHNLGWREMALVDVASARPPARIRVDEQTPDRAYLGPLGWSALTSYAGLFDVAELRDGDIVFVSGAAGAVGSLVVQIAKVTGHVVVGSAGSSEKVAYVTAELGADRAFCYRDGDVRDLLRDAAPDGIDVYFDNVGGDHLEAALDVIRPKGRIALCGAISSYNATQPVPGPSNLFNAVAKGLTLRGFLARMYAHRMDDFRRDMTRWLAEGSVVYPETVVEGLERAPRGFIAMLGGGNVGKSLVRI
jgi:NADPH-dependent curcumin reductase CurA